MKDNLEFLDILNILSFVIGIMNYNENLTQGDKQEIMSALDNKMQQVIQELKTEVDNQNVMLNSILVTLEELKNEKD